MQPARALPSLLSQAVQETGIVAPVPSPSMGSAGLSRQPPAASKMDPAAVFPAVLQPPSVLQPLSRESSASQSPPAQPLLGLPLNLMQVGPSSAMPVPSVATASAAANGLLALPDPQIASMLDRRSPPAPPFDSTTPSSSYLGDPAPLQQHPALQSIRLDMSRGSQSHGPALRLPARPVHMMPAGPPRPPRTTACVFCKKRKLRCPDEYPCRNCERRNIPCVDSVPATATRSRGKGKAKATSQSTAATAKPASRPPRESPDVTLGSNSWDSQERIPALAAQNLPAWSIPEAASAVSPTSSATSRTPPTTSSGEPRRMSGGSAVPLSLLRGVAASPPFAPVAGITRTANNMARSPGLAYKRVEEDLDFFQTGIRQSLQASELHFPDKHEDGVLQAIAAAAMTRYRWLRLSEEFGDDVSEDDQQIIRRRGPPPPRLIREPDNRSTRGDLTWFKGIVALFSPSDERKSLRVISSLVTSFFKANAIYVGHTVHTPSLMHMIFDPARRKRMHPALLPAILASALIDTKQARLEPYTGDPSLLDSETMALVSALYGMAARELQATAEAGSYRDMSMAQAATILALVAGPSDRAALLSMLEQTILANQWDRRIVDEPRTQGLSQPAYYSRPWSGSDGVSTEAQIEHEGLVRLAWTSSGHWARVAAQYPDREPAVPLHDFVDHVLPIGFWDPSTLPSELPEEFFRSQEVFRIGAAYMRIASHVAKLPADGTATREQGKWYTDQLDLAEDRLSRVRSKELPSNERPLRDELVRVVSRGMTPLRLSIWRKTGFWTERAFEDYIIDIGNAPAAQVGAGLPFKKSYVPPSIAVWLEVVGDVVDDLERDSSGDHTKGDLELSSTLSYVRALFQLHSALKEGGSALSLADRLLRTLPVHVAARERRQAPLAPSFVAAIEQTRQQLESMVLSDLLVPLAAPTSLMQV